MTLTIGLDTYASVADADTYLGQSIRAMTAWAALSTAVKEAALVSARRMLDRVSYAGAEAALPGLSAAVLNAGGSGYVVGDVLTIDTGTGVAAQIEVLTESGGAVATFRIIHVGFYSVDPSPLVGAATSGGTGTGATFDLTMAAAQALDWPRAGVGGVTATDIPQQIKDAQCELAYELSQDADLEAAADAGGDNVKRIKAGSVEIEKFLAKRSSRFPRPVMELLFGLTESSSGDGAGVGNYAGGVDEQTSSFDDVTSHDLNSPWR